MNYNFVKITDTRTGLEYPWILECNDLKTLVEHTDKCMGHNIRQGVQDWFNTTKQSIKMKNGYVYTPHFTTRWAGTCNSFAKMNGEHFITASTRLENQIWTGKAKQLFKGRTLYLREIGSYMIDCDTYEITNRLVTDKLVYPGYTIKDIVITRWPGGTHYYAKIGNMTVIDEHGNQKWNTYTRAKEISLKELKKY